MSKQRLEIKFFDHSKNVVRIYTMSGQRFLPGVYFQADVAPVLEQGHDFTLE